jgi:hypothetical protein
MSDELRFPEPGEKRVSREAGSLDERSARAIHDMYMPPVKAEDPYWTDLESRIMASIQRAGQARQEVSSLAVLNSWAQLGLVAATALLVAGGVISTRLGEPDEPVAYESVVSSAPEVITTRNALMTASDKLEQRDAALQYVLSY